MAQNKPIPCPECDREKYYEGFCYYCKNRKLRELYEFMSVNEVQEKINNIVANIETINQLEEIYQDFRRLLAYQDIDTEEIANAAFQKRIFNPPTLYRNASEEVQNKLIALLSAPDCKEANDILNCLAVIGSEKIKEYFYELEKSTLPWRERLHATPSVYAESGGWTLDGSGKVVELNYKECYALTKEDRKDNAVKVGEALAETCSVCKCRTVNILTINGNDERLSFLGLNGTIKIPVCPNCANMCEKAIIRYQLDGESTFEIIDPYTNENYVSDREIARLAASNFVLSQTRKPVYYACGDYELSTIGGHPEWVQNCHYEKCPDCHKKMKLLSALEWSQLLDGEGVLYIEICTDCSVIAVIHQQT